MRAAVRVTVAIDLTTGTYYVPYALVPDLRDCASPDMIDAVINSGKWRITSTYEGEVVASAVSLKESGEFNDAWTRLFVTP
ncbi:hypothetical protein [Myxococcus hansupus]|nr:hypothetical protein [Myxococcus hansupus]